MKKFLIKLKFSYNRRVFPRKGDKFYGYHKDLGYFKFCNLVYAYNSIDSEYAYMIVETDHPIMIRALTTNRYVSESTINNVVLLYPKHHGIIYEREDFRIPL